MNKICVSTGKFPPQKLRRPFVRVVATLALVTRAYAPANVVYTFREQVRNEMLPINPLGLMITYFREDQAFQE